MTIPYNIFRTYFENRFSLRRYFCKPPLPSKNILYLDVSQPAIYEDRYNMISGDVVYVPEGFGATDFGVSGLNVREIDAGTTNITSDILEDANYIFLPDTAYSTSQVEHSRDMKVFMGTARTGPSLFTQGGDIVHFLGGDSFLNIDGDLSTGALRSHVKASDMKTAIIYERVWLDNNGGPQPPNVYGEDIYKWGNTGNTQYTPDCYILDCGGVNAFSMDSDELTISSGSITPVLKVHSIDTESNAPTDTLSTITAGVDGQVLYLNLITASRTVTIDESDNIDTGGTPIELTSTSTTVLLTYSTADSKWFAEISSTNPRFGTLHGDIAQNDGKYRFLFIDGFTGSTNFQGWFFDPQAWQKASVVKNANLKYTDPTGTDIRHLYYLHYTDSDPALNFHNDIWPDIWIENVWCQKRDALSFGTGSIFPQSNSVGISAVITTDPQTGRDRASFTPEMNVRGYIKESSPDLGFSPFGDFVNRGRQAGNTTFVRQYADSNEAFFDMSKCVLWLNVQDFYSMNNKAIGQEHITSIFDNSGQYNHVTGGTAVANAVSQKGKNGLLFNGNDYYSNGTSTLVHSTDSVSESLLASSTNSFTVYNVVGAGSGTFFSKGNQLRFYITGGNVYGVCRGATTLIHSGHSDVALIGADWNGTSLVYIYNDNEITGSVGTNAENGANIELGRNGSTDYFSGSWFDCRVEYDSFGSVKRTEYYDRMNDIWNIDGTQTFADRPPNPVGVSAAIVGSNLRVSFTTTHTPGDKKFIGYYVRYKPVAQENYTTYGYTSVFTDASPIDVPLTTFTSDGDHNIKVTSRALSGFSDFGSSETVTVDISFAPQNTVAPSISGYEEEGEYQICNSGTWTGVPYPTFSYQWYRSGVPIVGATSSIYTLQAADVGETVLCKVLASNSSGSLEVATSASGTIGSATGGGFTDIDDIASVDIYMKTNDAGSITESGGAVSVHANQISGGEDAVQATSTYQPKTGTRTIGGANVFDFVPVDYLTIDKDISAGTEFSFGLVMQADNFSNERAVWDQSPGSTGVGFRTEAGGAPFLFLYTDDGLKFIRGEPLTAGTSYLIAGRAKSGFIQIWVNGGAPYAFSTDTYNSIVAAASDLIIGSRVEATNVLDGMLGNYFFSTDTFLRNVEIDNAMDKIATDFGLTWTPITL